MNKINKIPSILIILSVYVIALEAGYLLSYLMVKDSLLLQLFIMDVIATVIVYIASVIFKNTSVYDPYWSFVPPILVLIAIIKCKAYNAPVLILFGALVFWSWRLTINWIITFKGMEKEDWRYAKYRESNNRFVFEIINFFGLQMMPTILVYAATIPFLVMVEQGTNYLSLIGTAIVLFGAFVELFCDMQLHRFIRTTKELKTCQIGLWNYSRHPNYLGEISIWFGLAIPAIIQYPTLWYIYPGCVLMFLLFYFISIPLMEKRQVKRRSDYTVYQKTTSKLLILPKRKLKDAEEIAAQ